MSVCNEMTKSLSKSNSTACTVGALSLEESNCADQDTWCRASDLVIGESLMNKGDRLFSDLNEAPTEQVSTGDEIRVKASLAEDKDRRTADNTGDDSEVQGTQLRDNFTPECPAEVLLDRERLASLFTCLRKRNSIECRKLIAERFEVGTGKYLGSPHKDGENGENKKSQADDNDKDQKKTEEQKKETTGSEEEDWDEGVVTISDVRDKERFTLLHWACLANDPELVFELLYKYKHEVDCEGFNKQTPLMWAVMESNLIACMILKDFGADINHRDNLGDSSLILSIQHDSFLVCLWLLSHPLLNLNCKSRSSCTAAHWTCFCGDLTVGAMVYHFGGNFTTDFDIDGLLPIHRAVAGHHFQLVQFLLKQMPELADCRTKTGSDLNNFASKVSDARAIATFHSIKNWPKPPEDKKTEDKKTEDKKTEDKKTEDKKTDAVADEIRDEPSTGDGMIPEPNSSEDKETRDKETRDNETRDKKTDDKETVESEPSGPDARDPEEGKNKSILSDVICPKFQSGLNAVKNFRWTPLVVKYLWKVADSKHGDWLLPFIGILLGAVFITAWHSDLSEINYNINYILLSSKTYSYVSVLTGFIIWRHIFVAINNIVGYFGLISIILFIILSLLDPGTVPPACLRSTKATTTTAFDILVKNFENRFAILQLHRPINGWSSSFVKKFISKSTNFNSAEEEQRNTVFESSEIKTEIITEKDQMTKYDLLSGTVDTRELRAQQQTALQFFDLKRICHTCWMYRDLRTKHCAICDKCFERFDHHCIWIGQCVALNNHRGFVLFIILGCIAQVHNTALCGLAIILRGLRMASLLDEFVDVLVGPRRSFFPLLFTLATFMVHFMTVSWGVTLFGAQSMGVLKNRCINEKLNSHRYQHFLISCTENVTADGTPALSSGEGAEDGVKVETATRTFIRNPFDSKSHVRNCTDFWCMSSGQNNFVDFTKLVESDKKYLERKLAARGRQLKT